MQDPRFNTVFESRIRSENLPVTNISRQQYLNELNRQIVPASAYEVWCMPGYQPVRPNKGYVFSVDDYPFSPVKNCGGLWPQYVYKTCENPTNNF